MIQGINICNPVAVDEEYLMYAVDYAIKNKINHIQINGPIHNPEIGNIDGMTIYRKYSRFNSEKNMTFIEKTKHALNEATKITSNLKGYYFSELSAFPRLNHSKNHFYFELMKEKYNISSNEWFIPPNWVRGDVEGVLKEKEEALNEAETLLNSLCALKDKIEEKEFEKLLIKFKNLKYVAAIWLELTKIFLNYARYFESFEDKYEKQLKLAEERILKLDREGQNDLGEAFYCKPLEKGEENTDLVELFVKELEMCFEIEKQKSLKFINDDYTDFVICGGACEGHKLQKEVNFSDTYVKDGEIYRIPGSGRGAAWSVVNAHGWFSYEIKVKPDCMNKIIITMGSSSDTLNVKITVGKDEHIIRKEIKGNEEFEIEYKNDFSEFTRIRFDRIAESVPNIYDIRVL